MTETGAAETETEAGDAETEALASILYARQSRRRGGGKREEKRREEEEPEEDEGDEDTPSEETTMVQQRATEEWMREQGMPEPVAVIGEFVSGRVEERPGFQRVLAMLDRDEADRVVIHRLDRLARDVMVGEALLEAIWARGKRVFIADRGEILQDEPGSTARRRERIREWCSIEDEEERIRLRMVRARRAKIRRGGYGGGKQLNRRYGFRLVPGPDGRFEFEPIESEQRVIGRIVRDRATGISYRKIAAALDADEIPTPSGGKVWYPSTVERIEKGTRRTAWDTYDTYAYSRSSDHGYARTYLRAVPDLPAQRRSARRKAV
jgi:DNA invertase Pin-like site-specific DNA recombinase